jgi:diadenosine tetraphosphate (Ap4A) HIT family hydrolase
MFELDPRLEQDTVPIGKFDLSLVLMHRDANYPWCILVPQREGVREIHHLDVEDQVQLIKESSHLAEVMTDIFRPTKMNVAALGNMVPQLHVHHIARFKEDAAWPRPVWGAVEAKEYDEEELARRVRRLRSALEGEGFSTL